MREEQVCRVLAKRVLNPSAVCLDLAPTPALLRAQPGQFVHIRCDGALLLRRPISICGVDSAALRLVFEARGAGTAWLAAREPGESVRLLGPLGRGFALPEAGRILLVGGGVGTAPLLFCARRAPGRCDAVLGFRSRAQAVLLEELGAACGEIFPASDDGSLGFHGYVDALLRQVLRRGTRYAAVLACGPAPMLRAVAQAVGALPCQVSLEARMGCGVGACLVCTVPMRDGRMLRVCRDGPVFPAQEVDWNG